MTEATSVKIYGMYDCHLFEQYGGKTVQEIINNWLDHISKPQPAQFPDGRITDDLGPTALCPAHVLSGKNRLRRVGEMVFPDYKNRCVKDPEALAAYKAALEADPDIPRLLAGGKVATHRRAYKRFQRSR